MNPRGSVFDCMVFVQAIASPGSAHRCYQAAMDSGEPLWVSSKTLVELQQVLQRPELQRRLPGITNERVEALLHHLKGMAHLVEPVPSHFAFPPDPKDEPYLNLAIEAHAAFLVTRDRALLKLAVQSDELGGQLKSLHPSLLVLVPELFLASIRPRTIS